MSAAPATRPGAIVPVLAFSGIVVSLMQTIVIPLVPRLPELLNASAADTAWVVTATLLAGAVATPTMGRLGDMFGKRRMLLISIAVLVVGSVVVALSSSLVPAIIGRSLQGLAAGVIPLGISIMRDELPPERLASATAMMSASLGVGGALGLPASAALAQTADWHVLFWVAGGIAVVAGALVFFLVPESSQRTGGRIDGVGVVGLSVALFALLLGVSKGADFGWGSATTWALLGGSVVVFVLWGFWELRRREPLVDLRTFARPSVLFTNIASLIFGFGMFAMSLVIPQLLQLPVGTGYGLGQTMLVVGLVMAPSGLVMMAMAPVSARITASRGPKVTLMIAAVVVAAGYALMIPLMSQIWHFVLGSLVIGAGIGLGYGAMPALIMGSVSRAETASANSINTLMRSVGTSVASAVAGLILAHMTLDFGGVALPTQNAFRVVLGIGAVASLLAFAVAAFIPAGRRAAHAATVAAPLPVEESARVPAPEDRVADGRPVERHSADGRVADSRFADGRVLTGLVDADVLGPVTVTAHGRDGAVLAATTARDGRYRFADLPAGAVTLVATEHPAVLEPVTVGGGSTEHDVSLPPTVEDTP